MSVYFGVLVIYMKVIITFHKLVIIGNKRHFRKKLQLEVPL